MKYIKKISYVFILSMVLMFGMSQRAGAASSGDWKLNYIPGAPSSQANSSIMLYMDYYSGGYIVDCVVNTGTVKITPSSGSGIDPIIFEKPGGKVILKYKGSTTGTVSFRIEAMDKGCPCSTQGSIYFNR